MVKLSLKPKYNHREGNLIQVLLLTVIYENPSYGYEIIENINNSIVTPSVINSGSVYILLRRMESRGLVKSAWKENEKKPDKRVYTITHEGKHFLKTLLEFIIQRKQVIDTLEIFYKRNFGAKL